MPPLLTPAFRLNHTWIYSSARSMVISKVPSSSINLKCTTSIPSYLPFNKHEKFTAIHWKSWMTPSTWCFHPFLRSCWTWNMNMVPIIYSFWVKVCADFVILFLGRNILIFLFRMPHTNSGNRRHQKVDVSDLLPFGYFVKCPNIFHWNTTWLLKNLLLDAWK